MFGTRRLCFPQACVLLALLSVTACEIPKIETPQVKFGGPEVLYSGWTNPRLSPNEAAALRRECVYGGNAVLRSAPPRSTLGRTLRVEQCLVDHGFVHGSKPQA